MTLLDDAQDSTRSNEIYYVPIDTYRTYSDVPVVLNTSLNRRGEPIVNTPGETLLVFVETNMDYLCVPEARLLVSDSN